MDGVHDLGGMHGFGPVVPGQDEAVFHDAWEGRVFGMILAAALAGAGLPYSRAYLERMGAADYLTAPYFGRWLHGAELRAIDAGLVTREDLDARAEELAAGSVEPVRRTDAALTARVGLLVTPPGAGDQEPAGPAHRFAVGERVRAVRSHPAGHCRCPRYVRGVEGRVLAQRGSGTVLDSLDVAPEAVEPQYSIVFDPADLWGPDAEPGRGSVVVDLWERHLEEVR